MSIEETGGTAPAASPPDSAGAESTSSPTVNTNVEDTSPSESAGAFEGLGLDEIEIDDTAVAPVATKPVPSVQPPAQPEAAPAVTPEPAVPATAQPKPPAQEAVPQEPAAQPAPQPAPPAEPHVQLLQTLSTQRDALIDALGKSDKFQLTKEEADAFEQDALSVLPRYAGRVFYEAYTASVAKMVELVPAMVRSIVKQARNEDRDEDDFYSANPGLVRTDKTHVAAIARMAGAYRAANPSMGKEQFIKEVGALVAQSLGVANVAPAASAPAPKAAAKGGRAPATPPAFKPAIGSVARAPQPPVVEDPFAGLDKDFEEEFN